MKHGLVLRCLLLSCILAAASIAQAWQVVRPLSFPGTALRSSNFYADYVGIRFRVAAPLSIGGDKPFTTPVGAFGWGGAITTFTDTIKLAPTTDSVACGTLPSGYFAGKIALIWRGSCEYGYQALQAQSAGAVAVVIINSVPGGPVFMQAGASGGGVSIPVFMISLEDGASIAAQAAAGNTVVVNVGRGWGSGYRNDLGFVPQGAAQASYCAVPYGQLLFNNEEPNAFRQKEGAFIANYGTNRAANVWVRAQLSFQPRGSATWSVVHSDTVLLANFPVSDSIYAVFMRLYRLPATFDKGIYDIGYTLYSDSTDDFPGDNEIHQRFYTTDTLYSKGRYDFQNNRPAVTQYAGPPNSGTDPYIWMVPYFVQRWGGKAGTVQFSVAKGGQGPLPTGDVTVIYLFTWYDSTFGSVRGDGLMQSSELTLVGAGVKTYDSKKDSSFGNFFVRIGDSLGRPADCGLAGPRWYVVGAQLMPGYTLGVDGLVSGLPRAYGRQKFDGVFELYNPLWLGDRRSSVSSTTGAVTSMVANPRATVYPWGLDGTGTGVIDSVVFASQKGLIPALPFSITIPGNSTAQLAPAFAKFEVFPNPTTDMLHANISLGENGVNKVMYNIIDNSARVVASVTHEGVGISDVFSYNTAALAAGNYYLVVATTDGRTSFKKFVVVR